MMSEIYGFITDGVNPLEPDLAGVVNMAPEARLRAEIEVARSMYRSMQAGAEVDWARLCGAMAGALDNIAFYAEWCFQKSQT